MAMTGTTFTIGATATCSDGAAGVLTQVVVDPRTEQVTHVIVEPEHRSGLGKLVPTASVEPAGDAVHLRLTAAEFAALPAAEETHFLPGDTGGYGGFGPGQAMRWPYYGLGGTGDIAGSGLAMGSIIPPVTVVDALPAGETAIRRGDPVHASDGDIGRVQGLVFDRSTGSITHLLLQEGHFWGKHDVAIPVAAVSSFGAIVEISLTKAEIKQLPAVDLGG